MYQPQFCNIVQGNCLDLLQSGLKSVFPIESRNPSRPSNSPVSSVTHDENSIALTFLDPPFNQNKPYARYNDKRPEAEYWAMMQRVCDLVLAYTCPGGAIYFMQREKNAHHVVKVLESAGWCFQNMIVWRKKSAAIPCTMRFAKHYQVIVFATSGKTPRVFNKLRIDPPLLETEKYRRPNGMYITDVWDDIRELTSGYFAGDEPIRSDHGERLHNQQSPIELLARIILSSSHVGDIVFDPFAGTGTTLVVAKQLQRQSLGIEIDPINVSAIKSRLGSPRDVDEVLKFRTKYICTDELDKIWPVTNCTMNVHAEENEIGPLFDA